MRRERDQLADLPPNTRRWAFRLGGGGAVLLIALGVSAIMWPHAAMRSYLFAYVFWLNLSLGALGWLMLSHVTGGAWGRTTRRFNEAAAGVLPIMAALGVPLVIGAHRLYAWADAAEWQGDPVLLHRRPWVSLPWVAGRAGVLLAAFIVLAIALRRVSLAQDCATDTDAVLRLGQRMRTISQGGLVVLFVGVFLLAVDWVLSLEPHYISSIFGLVVLMGQATVGIAGVIVALWAVEHFTGRPVVSADRVHDLGKLLLTSVVLWAYMSFAQYLVQWMGHTQEDIRWYLRRLHGGWSWVAAALCVLHLGVPLLLLLSKPLKRSLASLAGVAAWVFLMRGVDVFWTIAPAGPRESVGGVYPTDPVAWLGLGGVWAAVFLWHLSRAPLTPAAYLTSGANVTGVVIATEGAAHAG